MLGLSCLGMLTRNGVPLAGEMPDTLPAGYGYADGDASALDGLASSDGMLPNSYGAPKPTAPVAQAPVPRMRETSIPTGTGYGATGSDATAAFVQGLTDAVPTFQPSSKSAPAAQAAPPVTPASNKWKAAVGITALTLLIGGTLWYLDRKQGE